METIIAAAISGLVTLIVCIVNNRAQQKKTMEQQERTTALLSYKLDELTKRVEKHNNIIERVYQLEGQMSECKHDIKDLKAYHKPQ